MSSKYIALEGGNIWHEYLRHEDTATEIDRGQVAMTKDDMVDAIMAIYELNMVEALFSTPNNPTQRISFA